MALKVIDIEGWFEQILIHSECVICPSSQVRVEPPAERYRPALFARFANAFKVV
jgi:hypothetical protein